MTKKQLIAAGTLVLFSLLFVAAEEASPQVRDTSSEKATEPPPNWVEQWSGMYAGQDHAGKNGPPGTTAIKPFDKVSVINSFLQPWALAWRGATDYERDDPGMLCKPTGLFIVGVGVDSAFQFMVAPDHIALVALNSPGGPGVDTGGVRRIYMNRPHLKNPLLTFNGDSVGHWEGDTLVIDTVGFTDRAWLTPDEARHSEELHVVERMRFVANGTFLENTLTVDDPKTLISPYVMTRYHKKLPSDAPIEEGVCGDSPKQRKVWLRIYKQSIDEAAEARAAAAKAAGLNPLVAE